jgi:hypothetical protein
MRLRFVGLRRAFDERLTLSGAIYRQQIDAISSDSEEEIAMSTTNQTAQSNAIAKVPSCIEIGLQASKKGNFQFARQMLQTAMEQVEVQDEPQPRLIDLMTDVADTFLSEGKFDMAKEWYSKALHRCELLQGENSLSGARLLTRLAEISVLQGELEDFRAYFDNVQRAYLLCEETNISTLLGSLIDLSWALCIRENLSEIQAVNSFIAQIKQLEEEEKLGLAVA